MKVIILLLYAVSASSAWANSLSLDDLKKMALKYSYNIKNKEADLKLSEINTDLAKSHFYPRLGIHAGKEWVRSDILNEEDDYLSVYGEINLFNGFQDSSRVKKQKINTRSIKSDFENFKFSLSLEVERTFYKYLYAKKKLSIISKEIARTSSHSKLVKKRYSSKLLTESDIIEFRLHQKKARSSKNYLKLEIEQLLSRILALTGAKNLKIIGKIPHLKLNSINKELLNEINKAPALAKFKFQNDIVDIDKTSTNSNWYPRLDLKAEHGKLDEVETGFSSNITSSRISLMATWELFSGFETTKNKEIQEIKKLKVSYAKNQMRQDLLTSLESKLQTLKMLEKTIEFEEENERLSNKLYKKTFAEYRKGIKDSGALIGASQKITDSQNRVFELKLNYLLTKLSLEKSVGRSLDFTLVHQ